MVKTKSNPQVDSKAKPATAAARVLIVDDHPVVREGLAMCISRAPNLEVCGEAADIADALQLVAATNPDVAIVDISLKTGNGIDLIKRIKARHESVKVLVWSMYAENLYAERALRAGAQGYITKEQATDKIIEALRRVLDGKVYLSEGLAEQLLNRAVGHTELKAGASPVEELSDRELEVFQLIGEGQDTQQIAKRMRLSPKTIETYRARVKNKLRLSTASELIRRAVQWVEQKG